MFYHLAVNYNKKIIVTLQSTTAKHKIKQIQHPQKILLKSQDSISSSKFLGSFVGKRGKRSWGNHQNWTLCCSAASNHCRSEEISGCIERTREFAKSAKHFAKTLKTVLVIVLCCSTMRRLKETGNAISLHFVFFSIIFYFFFHLLSAF